MQYGNMGKKDYNSSVPLTQTILWKLLNITQKIYTLQKYA